MASQTQRSRVADQLLQDIRDGVYPLSQKLPSERQLAEAFGVSRPVVREALGMLSSLDIVDIQVGRGAYVVANDVAPPRADQTRSWVDVNDAREALEMGALRLAANRARRSEKALVRAKLRALEEQVLAQAETATADHELHQAIVSAARSPVILDLWTDMADRIMQTIRLSPRGRVMSREIFQQHVVLASGVLDGNLDAALEISGEMHENNRAFLRSIS